ncbi:MAG TPA: DUF84 family protein [Bacillota bacterium]|nr:DUF84 family protein [Bacillota bacterium]
MNIAVGSLNDTKAGAVSSVFTDDSVVRIDAPSLVSAQPFSDEETLRGAINRATYCVEKEHFSMGIGLEGGVVEMNNQLFLCNWGALKTTEHTYIASGAKIPLPKEIHTQLKKGDELGNLIDAYAERKNVRQNEGTIGIFTNERMNRTALFTLVVQLLRGQYEFYNKK